MDIAIRQIVEYGVLAVLAVMSIITLYIVLERWMYFRSVDIYRFSDKDRLELALTKNLTLLYTIGANAVYIGLLGTVLGIIATFATIGDGGHVEAKAIMSNLSYTLIATAAGLVVAIPAMVFYNALVRIGDRLMVDWGDRHGS